jgi:hypothetical protein
MASGGVFEAFTLDCHRHPRRHTNGKGVRIWAEQSLDSLGRRGDLSFGCGWIGERGGGAGPSRRLTSGGWIGERGGVGSRRLTGGGSLTWRLDVACLHGSSSNSGEAGNWEWNTSLCSPATYIVVCCVGWSIAQQLQPIFVVSISFDYEFLHSCEFKYKSIITFYR